MKKPKLTRRDFIKTTAVTTAAAATALAAKEVIDNSHSPATIDDFEPKDETPQLNCLDFLKSLQQKS